MSDFDTTVQVKTERALIAYLKTFQGDGGPLDGVTFYAGHGSEDMTVYPRVVIAFSDAGGELAYDGNYEMPGAAVAMWRPDDPNGPAYHQALLACLNQEQLEPIQAVVNRPDAGPDNRAVKKFGIDSIMIGQQVEGRDDKDNIQGARVPLLVTAHNEAA